MQLSSDSIAQLAGALAKGQSELVNPAKSLTGVLASGQRGGQTYRYASLSAGLDIVRRVLGKHELAVIQTTSVDNERGLVSLTTTLAHSSGEWVSATWPVCRTADLQSPKWMGAALTYARRYGLFTLVGIAGEDDLDAPELPDSKVDDDQGSARAEAVPAEVRGGPATLDPAPRRAGRRTAKVVPTKSVLAAPASAAKRDRLQAEMAELTSGEDLAIWAKRILPDKNTLTAEDARFIEHAFETRILALESRNLESTDQTKASEHVATAEPEFMVQKHESWHETDWGWPGRYAGVTRST